MTASLDTPVPGEVPGVPGLPAAVTAPAAVPLAELDARIAGAFRDLGRARIRFADTPSGEAVEACLAAEAAMNHLLDQRADVARPAATGSVAAPG